MQLTVHWQRQAGRKSNQHSAAIQQQLSAVDYIISLRITNEHFIFNQHLIRQTNINPLPSPMLQS
jgi:hypothetical protein